MLRACHVERDAANARSRCEWAVRRELCMSGREVGGAVMMVVLTSRLPGKVPGETQGTIAYQSEILDEAGRIMLMDSSDPDEVEIRIVRCQA